MAVTLLLWTLLTLFSITASVAQESTPPVLIYQGPNLEENSKSYFLVAFPAVIQYPDTPKFCVLLQSLSETVHVRVTLEMENRNHKLLEKDVAKPHYFECISFQAPHFTPREKGMYGLGEEVAYVHVWIHNGRSVSFDGRKKVLIREVYHFLYVDQDKPFYKPGETVKFRIVKLDDNLKAINETIPLVELNDPSWNRIAQWVNVETQKGIADLSFPLASEAALGHYYIKVEDKTLTHFEVQEYVLPKVEVLLEVPKLVTTSDKEIRIKVMGRYTYGKGVRGSVQLTLTRRISYYFREEEQNGTLTAIKKEYTAKTDKSGSAFITINATDINLSQKGYDDYLWLSAELEEEGTGAISSGSARISLVTQALDVTFVNLNPFYKHGFPYTGKMKCAINDIPFKNETIYLTVDVNDVETHFTYVTDEKGEVHFSLDTTKWNDTLVSLRGRHSITNVTAEDAAEIMEHEAFTWLKPFYSESNSFLEIRHIEEELPCGKAQEVLVDYIIDRKELGPEADHVDFYYLVVSKGKVILSGQKAVPIGQDETLKGTFALTLSVSMDLAPTARLLLYAVFADGEVAADVDVFTIEKCLRHQVKLGFSEEEDLPGAKVELQVEAAPGALCSLRAVDKSVILKEDRALTPEDVYRSAFYDDSDYLIGTRGFDYHLEDFEPYPCLPSGQRRKRSMVGPWFESQADAYSLFKQLRMKVLTNTQMKKPVSCIPQTARSILKMDEMKPIAKSIAVPPPVPEVAVMFSNDPQPLGSKVKKEEKGKPRIHFPETWIWDLVPLK